MNTLEYYNQHADEFINGTASVDMKDLYGHFLPLLKPGASILDLGCGSGRDSRYFLDHGFQVTAIDGSPEICKRASDFINHPVACMRFDEIAYVNQFEGVWACASLLHVPKNELHGVLKKISTALKSKGILYVSFKYGFGERSSNGRHFSDFSERDLDWLLSGCTGLILSEHWVSADVRKERPEEKWLNMICRKEQVFRTEDHNA